MFCIRKCNTIIEDDGETTHWSATYEPSTDTFVSGEWKDESGDVTGTFTAVRDDHRQTQGKRIDENNGQAYTKDEFVGAYGGACGLH